MKKYTVFLFSGLLILMITYIIIFAIPGKLLIKLINNNTYFGILARVIPLLFVFGDSFIVASLLLPLKKLKIKTIALVFISVVITVAGIAMAVILNVSPVSISNYNGLRLGYIIISGLTLLFFTIVIHHYLLHSDEISGANKFEIF